MKKLIFAIQVLGLIAMIPAYVATELNQGKIVLNGSHPASVITENLSQKNVQTELNSNTKSKNTFLNWSNSGLIN